MKKILSTILALALLPFSIHAAFSPTYEKPTRGEFTSPARIVNMSKKTPFAFEIQAGSDIDALSFYSNPAKMLGGKPAEELASYLAGQDLEFWQNNPQLVQVFSSLDDNFP